MSKRKRQHYAHLSKILEEYTNERSLDFERYSDFHMRLMDGGFTTLDVWTTGRYYVLHTDYSAQDNQSVIERGGEKGMVPLDSGVDLYDWLDKLFYAVDMAEEQ